MIKKISTLTFLFLSTYVFSQQNINDSIIKISLVETSVSIQKPSGDFSDRFGNGLSINLAYHYKTSKNFTFGIQIQNLIGENVSNQGAILGDINTDFGPITGTGSIGEVLYTQRGMNTSLQFGKIFNISESNPNSGIWAQFGLGYFWSKININNVDNRIPILTNDFIKGYDKLAQGFAINQSIGYLHLSNKRLLNFSVALESMQAFTKDQRGYDYVKNEKSSPNYIDVIYGLRFSWILPLYKKSANKYHYY